MISYPDQHRKLDILGVASRLHASLSPCPPRILSRLSCFFLSLIMFDRNICALSPTTIPDISSSNSNIFDKEKVGLDEFLSSTV